MKISKNEPFDLETNVRAFCILITFVTTELYQYMYYLTFMHANKSQQGEFNDPYDKPVSDLDFFGKVDDPCVKKAFDIFYRLVEGRRYLLESWDIDEWEDFEDTDLRIEALRFRPYFLWDKESKNYEQLSAAMTKTLSDFLFSIYLHASAMSENSFEVSLKYRKRFGWDLNGSLQLLKTDITDVAILRDILIDLEVELSLYEDLFQTQKHLIFEASRKAA